MFEPSWVKYFSSSKTTQHFDLYNKLASFLHKFFAFSACFSVYLGVFSRLKQEMFIFDSCLQIVIWETPNLQTKASLTDSFAIIGQSFQLILSGRCPGSWAASLTFVFDWLFILETIYGIINSSSGVTFFLKVIHNFWFFHLWNHNFEPFSKRLSLGLI